MPSPDLPPMLSFVAPSGTGKTTMVAEVIARLAAERDPSLHRSTVYRTLDALGELGVVDHVHLGHSGAVYHFADDGDLHVVCSSCEQVAHVDPAVLTEAVARIDAACRALKA